MPSAHRRVVPGSTPNASSVQRLFERAVQTSARPFDTMSSVARRSATRIGWFQRSITAAMIRSVMLLVREAIAA